MGTPLTWDVSQMTLLKPTLLPLKTPGQNDWPQNWDFSGHSILSMHLFSSNSSSLPFSRIHPGWHISPMLSLPLLYNEWPFSSPLSSCSPDSCHRALWNLSSVVNTFIPFWTCFFTFLNKAATPTTLSHLGQGVYFPAYQTPQSLQRALPLSQPLDSLSPLQNNSLLLEPLALCWLFGLLTCRELLHFFGNLELGPRSSFYLMCSCNFERF